MKKINQIFVLIGSFLFAQTSFGQCNQFATFNGNSDYIDMNWKGISGANSRTVEAWIKTTKTDAVIVSWGGSNVSQGRNMAFYINNSAGSGTVGALRLISNNGLATGSIPVNDGQWHHVACVFEDDGTPDVIDFKFYVDGVLDQLSNSGSRTINTILRDNVTIGRDGANSAKYFQGEISEVRIWSVAKTTSQIQATMTQSSLSGSEAGLEVYYTFENGATDKSANGRNGVNHGAIFGDNGQCNIGAPSISLSSNGTTFQETSDIIITANPTDSDGTIDRVEISENGAIVSTLTTAPYQYIKGNVGVGSYSFSAIAYDNEGNTTASNVLNTNVIPSNGGGGANIDNLTSLRINTAVLPAGYQLAVDGKIIAEEVRVLLSERWPDYVFLPSYKLKTLEEVEAYISANGHLPNIPSATKMETEGGIDVSKMNVRLVEKVEELTLYSIQLNKEKKELMEKQKQAILKITELENRMMAIEEALKATKSSK